MTDPQEDSQDEGLGSDHDQNPEGCASGGPGVQDIPPGPLRGPDASGQQAPAELDRRGREAGEVGNGEVLPGLDQGSLEQQGLSLELEEQSFHVGPLPSPSTLAAYEAVAPGSAERIIHVMERTILGEEDRRDRAMGAAVTSALRGQAVAAILAFILVAAAIAFMWRGQMVAGSILLGLPAILLVRAFMSDSKGSGGDS